MADSDCLVCLKSLPENGVFLTCSECDYSYHIGSCSGVSKTTYKAKGDVDKSKWKCQTCETSKARGAEGAVKQKPEQAALEKVLMEINKKLTELQVIRCKVDELMLVKETVNKLEQSVQHMSEQYDEVLKEMKRQSTEIATLKKKVEKIEADNAGQEIQKLRIQVNSLEQYSRRQNLEIHGLPQTDNENLLNKINELATELQLPELSQNELEGVHRLFSKPGKTPAVLIRFVSRITRDQWMAKRGLLKNIESNVYFLDNLTPQNKKLLWLMRVKAEEKRYQFAWQKNGLLFVRKAAGERAIVIECEADLDKIC